MNLISPIKTVHIENFRGIRDLTIDLDSHVTVFFGPNAVGKTTIMDALAIGLGAIVARFPKSQGRSFKKRGDIRIPWISRTDLGEKSGVECPFTRITLTASNGLSWDVHKLRSAAHDKLTTPSVGVKALHEALDPALRETLMASRDDAPIQSPLPLVAAYGTERAMVAVPLRRRDFNEEFDRLSALHLSLDAVTRFKEVFEWFIVAEDEERREKERRQDFNYCYPALESVRMAIEKAGLRCRRPRIETRPHLRMTVDFLHPEETPEQLKFSSLSDDTTEQLNIASLSDGYRTHFSLIVDIARRMVQLNPSDDIDDPVRGTNSEAVILIDEIDLHLDPTWQATVVGGLKAAFPNAQFVITTHSEQVIGSVPASCVRKLITSNGEVHVENVPFAEGATNERILIELMGANERVPGEITNLLSRYLDLVDQDSGEEEEAQSLRKQLDAALGDDERLRQADLEIEKRRILAKFSNLQQ
jgi:predicted ATP-binding protein involved in virulence